MQTTIIQTRMHRCYFLINYTTTKRIIMTRLENYNNTACHNKILQWFLAKWFKYKQWSVKLTQFHRDVTVLKLGFRSNNLISCQYGQLLNYFQSWHYMPHTFHTIWQTCVQGFYRLTSDDLKQPTSTIKRIHVMHSIWSTTCQAGDSYTFSY